MFDEALLAAEPIERGVDLARGDAAKAESFAQGMTGGLCIQHARGCQFGRRIEQPGDDQRQCQVTAALRGSARQQIVEADAPGGGQRGEHVAVRQRAADFEAALAHRDQRVPAQGGAQGVDAVDWHRRGWQGCGS